MACHELRWPGSQSQRICSSSLAAQVGVQVSRLRPADTDDAVRVAQRRDRSLEVGLVADVAKPGEAGPIGQG